MLPPNTFEAAHLRRLSLAAPLQHSRSGVGKSGNEARKTEPGHLHWPNYKAYWHVVAQIKTAHGSELHSYVTIDNQLAGFLAPLVHNWLQFS